MKKLKPPQFLNDLYRDLRDRRMLIPVIALVVPIFAVPMSLGGSEEVQAPPPASPIAEEGIAVESAVLVGEPGIRNYSERLAALKSKNPFEQKFQLPQAADATGTEVVDDGAIATDSGTAVAAGGTDTGAAAAAPPVDTGAPDPSTGAPSVDTTSPDVDTTSPDTVAPADPTTSEPAPEIRFYAGRVDVAIGPIGEGKTYRDVRYLNFLPNDKAPVVAFIGLAEGGDRAIFSVSSDVNMGKGDGSCAPKKPDPCQFLTMKVGDERFMKYGIEGTPFRLKLLDTEIVRVPDPRDGDAG